MTDTVVEILDLHKRYRDVVAVDGLSLHVRRGEVLGVLGPNGAGKTTTVECAAGLRRPDSGTVRVLGRDPWTDGAEVRQRVGVQLQHAALPDRMTVAEAMAVFAAGIPAPRRSCPAAGRVGAPAAVHRARSAG